MSKTAIKLGVILQGNERLDKLEIDIPFYLNIAGEQYCDYLEITRIDKDNYQLLSLWKKEDGFYTAEEVLGTGYHRIDVKYNKEIMSEVAESKDFEHVERVSDNVSVDDLYLYTLEEAHCYCDEDRCLISLGSFNMVKVEN